MTHGNSAVPLAAIEALHATILMACALAEGGRRIDLMGLDGQAATLCTAVALLPRSEAEALAPALLALVSDVERLAATLPAPLAAPPATPLAVS